MHAVLSVLAQALAADPFPSHATNEWVWVPMEGSTCMNGEETGVYVKYGSKGGKGVGIYMDGGGACFNAETCVAAAANAHPGTPGTGGIFADSDDRNPFAGFSWVHIPYCTGDVHTGNITHQFSFKDRHFQGHNNLRLMAERAILNWPQPSQLVVTGESAGGFGAASNYHFVRSFWKDVKGLKGVLLDDSGPILDDKAIAPCLQEKWRTTWNLNAALPPSCPCKNDAGNLVSVWNFTKAVYPSDSLALVSTLKDGTISTFFSYGELNCKNSVAPVGYSKLEGGLKRLAASGVPCYLISGTEHTHTGSKGEFYTREVNDVLLYKWVTELLAPGPDPASVIPK